MTALLLCAAVTQPAPAPALAFDALTIEQATRLNGARLTIAFTSGKPAYTWPVHDTLRTIVGPADIEGDDTERTVVLRGNRLADVTDGKRFRVTGVLRVIHHDAATINDVRVEAWAEVRFEEG